LINWHRLFGLVLKDYFTGSPFVVEVELDLAFKRQLLDVLILRKALGEFWGRLPDGLDNLDDYNLLTFKSHHEALDDWTLKELTGHYVNYRKQVSATMRDLLPESRFRLYGVCSRFPQNLPTPSAAFHTNLRISVTDRCNIRCFYCMPEENVQFKPRHELLTFEEIERFVRVVARLGVRKLRFTGGEPLVRPELPALVAQIGRHAGHRRHGDDHQRDPAGPACSPGAEASRLAAAEHQPRCHARGDVRADRPPRGLDQVLDGIAEAQRQGFRENPPERRRHQGASPKTRSCRWPALPASTAWNCGSSSSCRWTPSSAGRTTRFLTARDPRDPGSRIRTARSRRPSRSQPAGVDYRRRRRRRIGFINPVSEPFLW
jgi:hypothetical protein